MKRILFATSFIESDPIERAIVLKLADSIASHAETVGILNNGVIPETNEFRTIYSVQEITEEEWDVILIYSLPTWISISSKIKVTPLVFLTISDSIDNQCFNVPNLHKVIAVNKNTSCSYWGIPPEFASILYISPYDFKKRNNIGIRAGDEQLSVVYCSDANDKSKRLSRIIINLFNYLQQFTLTIVCSSEEETLLRGIANDNIHFLRHQEIVDNGFKENHLIIASGLEAAYALCCNYRVIVLGEYGLGGLVNEGNVHDFIKINFRGRIGGTMNEAIPANFLLYEIQRALGIIESDLNFGDMRRYTDYLSNRFHEWPEAIENIIHSIYQLHNAISKSATEELLAILSPQWSFQHTQDDVMLINRSTGEFLGSIGESERVVINEFSQESIVLEVLNSYSEYASDDLFAFILELWGNKALHLRVQTN